MKKSKQYQKQMLIEHHAEGKASSVQFIHFKFNDDQINKFKSGNINIELGIDHKEYSHATKLTEDNIKSLSADFI